MATAVDIANLALSHLGDDATVASLDPPEGSPQAEHCARFLPLARDALLQLHPWDFSACRAPLALFEDNESDYNYCYVVPNDCITINSVEPMPNGSLYSSLPSQGFVVESHDNIKKIFTNTPNAVIRYQRRVDDTSLFSPLFTVALSWKLASLIAGPVIKGELGASFADKCEKMVAYYISQAIKADMNQRNIKTVHSVPWMESR